MKSKIKQTVGRYTRLIISLFLFIAFAFPFLWMVYLSLSRTGNIFSIMEVPVKELNISAYIDVIMHTEFISSLFNSLVVSLSVTGLTLIFSAPAAYAFSRFKTGRLKDISFWILILRMVPTVGIVIPFFLIAKMLGLVDTRIILILAYLSFNIPFAIWILTGFFEGIPVAMEEAAFIDGCGQWGAFIKIVIPNVIPGLIACSILTIIFSWNEFLIALVLTDINARTLPVTVSSFLTWHGTQWPKLTAAGTLVTLPVIIFSLIMQKRLVQGLTKGAIKG